MGVRSLSWSADGNGSRVEYAASLPTSSAGSTPAAAAVAGRHLGLDARQSPVVAGEYSADAAMPDFSRLDHTAAGAISFDRRGLDRKRSAGLPRIAGQSATGRLLGIRSGVVFVFRLRLLSVGSTLAGGYILCRARIRRGLAAVAVGTSPRSRCALFLHSAACFVVD